MAPRQPRSAAAGAGRARGHDRARRAARARQPDRASRPEADNIDRHGGESRDAAAPCPQLLDFGIAKLLVTDGSRDGEPPTA
ncbi:MAG: hypothetical protein U1E76_21580 [Planctomycetota bacterium]